MIAFCTRIGAADNVAEGKSTFLVEMEETALICTQATRNSLVILDEVGRGTSTFDGLAIAQAVVEYIYTNVQALCLFATHYHELAQLTEKFSGITISLLCSKYKDPSFGIILLHKILPGIADGSFGLEVAKLAQLPDLLINRAREILELLTRRSERHQVPLNINTNLNGDNSCESEFDVGKLVAKCAELESRRQELEDIYKPKRKRNSNRTHYRYNEIKQIDCEQLTAKQALEIIWRLKEDAK